MKVKCIFALIVLPVLAALGCSQEELSADPPSPNVVASFNGGLITKGQLKARFEGLMPCCKGRYKGELGAKTLIKEMVLPVAISQAIKHKKIDLRETIREKMGNLTNELNISFLHMKFHERILNSDEKYKDLKERYEYQKNILNGVPLSERFNRLVQLHQGIHHKIAKEVEEVAKEYVGKLRSEASISKSYDALKVNVTEEELKYFYQRHKEGFHGDEYRIPERVKIRQVTIKIDKTADPDCLECSTENEKTARNKAESALAELKSGAGFKAVAEKYASDNSEPMKPTWVARGSEGKEFDEAVFSLDVGEISRVFKRGGGFSIAELLERRPGRLKSYDEITDQIEREYRWHKGEDHLKQNKDKIIFTINGKPYTIGDLIKEYTRSTPPHACHHMKEVHGHNPQKPKANPPQLCDLAHNTSEEQKAFVDRMIDRELIVEDTYDQMIHVEHKKEIEFLTMASLYPIFHQEEMDHLIRITDDMVKEYYEKNRERYQYPAHAKISMIVVRGGDKEKKEEAFQRAKEAYDQLKPSFFSLKKGKPFAEVARKYSDDKETASKGGRLDLDVSECRNAIEYTLLHGFHKKIFELGPGDISDIFEFRGNYYIVQINDMKPRKHMVFEEIKAQVKNDLMEKEHGKIMEKWEDDLLNSAGFLIYDQVLKQAVAEASVQSTEPAKVKGS